MLTQTRHMFLVTFCCLPASAFVLFAMCSTSTLPFPWERGVAAWHECALAHHRSVALALACAPDSCARRSPVGMQSRGRPVDRQPRMNEDTSSMFESLKTNEHSYKVNTCMNSRQERARVFNSVARPNPENVGPRSTQEPPREASSDHPHLGRIVCVRCAQGWHERCDHEPQKALYHDRHVGQVSHHKRQSDADWRQSAR